MKRDRGRPKLTRHQLEVRGHGVGKGRRESRRTRMGSGWGASCQVEETK